MFRIIFLFLIGFLSLAPGYTMQSEKKPFDERTLQELVIGSEKVFRGFGINNLNLPATKLFIRAQVIPKHGQEMYILWQQANNWAKAGSSELIETRESLKNSISFNAKQIIVGKLKDKSFVFLNLSEKKIKEKALLTVQKGKMKIEIDLTGEGYDLVFQYKFSDNIGLIQQKEYKETSDVPILSKSKGTKVLVVVIGMYDFLDEIWNLTEKSGMTTESEVLKLISTHSGRIKSIYPVEDYTF